MSVISRHEISKGVSDTSVDVAIVGAGPYGLSVVAHLRAAGVAFRIFGQPMHGWLAHMPSGMLLKSEGFASNLYDADGYFTLKQFCRQQGSPYADTGVPVSLKTFAAYGLAFQKRLVPSLERKKLVALDHDADQFLLRFEDGELVPARNVVLAVGIANFQHLPAELAHLPTEFVSHSSHHADLRPLRDRRVAVIGAGSSAIDLASLLNESGTQVQLIARRSALRFHSPPTVEQRSFWQNIRYPMTGMGPGLRARLYTDAPRVFHSLPQRVRRHIVLDFAPPEGGWFSKDRVIGRIPLLLGYSAIGAEIKQGEVHLRLLAADRSERQIVIDHVVAATGYRVDLARLTFLSDDIRSSIRLAYRTPMLSSKFESSIPGLYFVGLPAVLSFGPMMRFALGAGYTAQRLTTVLKKSLSRRSSAYDVLRPADLANSN